MPTFATPGPISVTVELFAGDVHIVAEERSDTSVEVMARSEASAMDAKAVAGTRIHFSDGKLTVKATKSLLQTYVTGLAGTVDVTVHLPAGSHVRGHTATGDFVCEGALGEVRLKTSQGDIRLSKAGPARLSTMQGHIFAERMTGECAVVGSGEVRITTVDGKATVKNLHGDSWIGYAAADITLSSAHGHIIVERADAGVVAKTAHGNVRVGDVARGSVVVLTASGELEIGIREGTAAWLTAKSSSGRVRSSLDTADGPQDASETVNVLARTYDGDILIRRAG
jgi:DUF4097 and DUF4098 domain-containing protein YvlB